jgi:hypothetical protein
MVIVQVLQIVLESGQRGRDNGLVNGGHHQRQGHDGEDQVPPRLGLACLSRSVRRVNFLFRNHASTVLCLPAGNYPWMCPRIA